MDKILITAGSSFSECQSEWIETWPRHLAKNFKNHISLSRGATGNGYISRSVIYEASKHNPEDIVVAIQWTGWDRIDLRIEQLNYIRDDAEGAYNLRKGHEWPDYPVKWDELNANIQEEIRSIFPNLEVLLKDPQWNLRQGFVDSRLWTNVLILLDDKQYRNAYFLLYEDDISKQIYTLEHILRTQWFLESNNIPYIMIADGNQSIDFTINSETEHLTKMLREIINPPLIEWTMKNYGKAGFPNYPDMHPATPQHKRYTEEIIIPYMENKCLL